MLQKKETSIREKLIHFPLPLHLRLPSVFQFLQPSAVSLLSVLGFSSTPMVLSPFILLLSFFFSLTILLFFAPHFFTPQLSPADLDDLALFRKATLQSSHPFSSFSRLGSSKPTPKIAFLFLTNSDLTFAPLWERFFHGNHLLYNLYVHADPFVKITPPGGVFSGRFIPSKKTERSSPSLISAERRLLANALIDDPLNLYFALVSQHCIPLHSFSFIYESLFKSLKSGSGPDFKSFIEIVSDDPNLPERFNARGDGAMLPEVPFEQFRVGSQFFMLNRRHAGLVVKESKLWKKFRLPCLNHDACYPEEHYFPTLLSMKDPKSCSHYTLTNVNWTGMVDGHPHTYSAEEISVELIRKLRVSNSSYSYFFSRKFSPECLQPLMKMADDIILRD